MFGLGDQVGYPETFLDAMGIVYRKFLERGAVGNLGFWSTAPYTYFNSLAVYDDQFCGLAIDEDNEPELTDERIDRWCEQIVRELNLSASYPSEAKVEVSPRATVEIDSALNQQ